jgi:hypothetical protein
LLSGSLLRAASTRSDLRGEINPLVYATKISRCSAKCSSAINAVSLRRVTGGVEALFDELSKLMKRPLKGHAVEDQPDPDCPVSRRLREIPPTHLCNLLNLERETRLELATPTLARPEETKLKR